VTLFERSLLLTHLVGRGSLNKSLPRNFEPIQNSDCAIFSRNYSEHLDEAVKISNSNPRQPITFRSSVVWSSAKKAIETHGQRKIYFATVGDYNLVRYEGNLEKVELNPELNLSSAQELLLYCTQSTREEGLWEEVGKVRVKTENQFFQEKTSHSTMLDSSYNFLG
ncbi:hypothetical protein, partial [Nostoc sp.]|uniref:hypothetical protein n=1 Tax=Nostoc sp. TaxID=1180 RepID=UPI002FF9DF4A